MSTTFSTRHLMRAQRGLLPASRRKFTTRHLHTRRDGPSRAPALRAMLITRTDAQGCCSSQRRHLVAVVTLERRNGGPAARHQDKLGSNALQRVWYSARKRPRFSISNRSHPTAQSAGAYAMTRLPLPSDMRRRRLGAANEKRAWTAPSGCQRWRRCSPPNLAGRTWLTAKTCVLEDIGRGDFDGLQTRVRRRRWYPGCNPVALCAFELLDTGGPSAMALPLVERKGMLAKTQLVGVPRHRLVMIEDCGGRWNCSIRWSSRCGWTGVWRLAWSARTSPACDHATG